MTDEDLWYRGYCMTDEEYDDYQANGLDYVSGDDWDDSDDPYDD